MRKTERTVAERIRTLRRRAGITQWALAQKLHVSSQAVAYWEGEYRTPSAFAIVRLAAVFGVTTGVILGTEPLPKLKSKGK